MSFYAPPQDIETSVFTSVPQEFRLKDTPSDWGKANKPGQQIDSFLEGPSFDREGYLYVTDIPYGRIFRISPQGEWELIIQYDGWPNGLKIHKDGRIFIADYKNGIMLLDPVARKIEPFLTHCHSESFKGVNDLIFDSRERLYFTDQGQSGMHDPTGRVFRYDFTTSKLERLISNGISPNGLVLSPEENVLYVGMTRGNAVWRLPLMMDGTVSKVGIFTPMAGGVSGADGLAIDEDGRVFVCDAGNACVWGFSKYGEPIYRIKACSSGRTTTNLAFGGKDNRTLYFTESASGTILMAEMNIPGKKMFSHM